MSKRIIMWGATGQAKVLREMLPRDYSLVALFDNDPAAASPFEGVPIHHGKDGFARWRTGDPQGDLAFLVAIGGDKGADRIELARFLESSGLIPFTAIHPTAYVAAGVVLGKGCQILARACVCVDAILGDGVIVNTGAIVDHECELGEGAHVGPGAILAGCVSVGPYAFVGAGAVVLPRITLGRGAVVGAGAVVTKDVGDAVVVAGSPAAPVGRNTMPR